jgi:hypothetical protein
MCSDMAYWEATLKRTLHQSPPPIKHDRVDDEHASITINRAPENMCGVHVQECKGIAVILEIEKATQFLRRGRNT